jgi:ASC-1-like (ASCH) protein
MKTLWIRAQYMQQILAGLKTTEVRVAYPNITRLEAGDELLLNDRHRYLIRRIATYPDFPTLLANEDPAAIAPGLTKDELLTALREIYPTEREALGAVAIEIEPLPAERA